MESGQKPGVDGIPAQLTTSQERNDAWLKGLELRRNLQDLRVGGGHLEPVFLEEVTAVDQRVDLPAPPESPLVRVTRPGGVARDAVPRVVVDHAGEEIGKVPFPSGPGRVGDVRV